MKDLNQFVGTYPFSKNHPVAKKKSPLRTRAET